MTDAELREVWKALPTPEFDALWREITTDLYDGTKVPWMVIDQLLELVFQAFKDGYSAGGKNAV